MLDHRKYLVRALELAREAVSKGSNPIGVVIVNESGEIISEGYNEIKIANDPTAHGEVVAMRKGGKAVMKKFSPEPTYIFTTLEPCFACGFFITRTNIKTIVWALNDPYKGGIDFLKDTHKLAEDFKTIELIAEPIEDLKEESRKLMHDYYIGKGEIETAKYFE